LRKAVTSSQEADSHLANCQSNLCTALTKRFQWRRSVTDLDEAIDFGRQSISHPSKDQNFPRHLSSLAFALERRYEYCHTSTDAMKLFQDRKSQDLKEMVEYAETALAMLPESHPEIAFYHYCLSIALWRRGTSTDSVSDLQNAIRHQTAGIDNTGEDSINLARYLYNLCAMQLDAFSRTDSLEMLNESLTNGQRAVNMTPRSHSNWPLYVDGLVASLQARYERTGNITDLNGSIDCLKDALKDSETRVYESSVANYQHRLGVLLRMRHEVLGSVDDLTESIENGKASVQMHAPPGCYNMLGTAQLRKFQLFGSMEDLDESIKNITKSIRLCENDIEKTHTKYHNLSLALMSESFEDIFSGRLGQIDRVRNKGFRRV
jgi:tetratricopeptide (TPR) repeat protein